MKLILLSKQAIWPKNYIKYIMTIFLYYLFQFILLWQTPCELEGNVALDEFQNVYIYDDTSLLSYNKAGVNHFSYSNLRKGEITSVDVTNPLRIVVYYGENNEVVFLDNTLSEQNQGLGFNDLSLYDVSLVCSSFQNHLWLYRSAEQKLVRINRNGEVQNETASLALWTEGDLGEFVLLKESGNFLYLVSSEEEVLVFDQYGTFRKKILISEASKIHFSESKILYLNEKDVYAIDAEVYTEPVLLYSFKDEMIGGNFYFNLRHAAICSQGLLSLSEVSN
jgi:hypothetical protein